MKKLLFTLAAMLVLLVNSQASCYTINDSQLDEQFSKATATELVNFNINSNEVAGMGDSFAQAGEKNAIVAAVLAFFLGGLGIHRFYLGTKTFTGIGYLLTCFGIFGIVPLVDFIVILINSGDLSAYIDNPKFFMW
ncbi:MAG: TM2 domain-containing protein [Marinifilaceae bacterium]|jgi:TM2 domain-containing membrane protein YozV|nr:TM2 domain-containing protein [Marinifilaceae bacterium]